ncbi:MAG: peptidoglycan DD-metalloendopeptidase family protein [Oscillospiraceae bacterium]|nr:peptidoglycan DD-metalloendopeptidase family protein [Oscillospiraceae bacterium]
MKNRKRLAAILAGIMAAVMLLSLILGLLPTPANAASSSEIKKQINALKEQKEEIQAQIEEVKAQYQANEDEIADIVARKNVIDQEIGLLSAQIVNINEQISSFNVLIADKQDELDNAEDRYDELSAKNKERVRAMEEDGSVSYWEVIFKANSFSDLLDRLNMVAEIAASDRRRLKELGEAADAVEEAQSALELEKADLEVTRTELNATQVELDAKREEVDALIQELLSKGEDLEELEKEFQKQKTEFLDEIAKKEKEYNEAKHQEWLAYMATYTTIPPTTTAPPTTTNNGGTTNSGGSSGGSTNTGGNSGGSSGVTSNATWLVPCSYRMMTSPFGYRKSPTAGASSYHQGVDLAGPKGTPIYATRTGVVTTARYSNSAGWYVSINHGDGFSSIYMHMESYVVSAGQAVSAGQLIGYMGSTGISTGSHLHFGIAYNGAYVNPCNYVNLS